MKGHRQLLALATAVLAFPLFAYSQNATDQNSQAAQASSASMPGQHEATLMRPARATLVHGLDADKDKTGAVVTAKLERKIKLSNGAVIPAGAIFHGAITTDDMQQGGMSKLALVFNQATLKDGTNVPIRATLVGVYAPDSGDIGLDMDDTSGNMPIDWTKKTLQMDQENALPGVDLHSKISSKTSGVFVSTKKSDFKIRAGSEFQFAVGPATNAVATDAQGGADSGGK